MHLRATRRLQDGRYVLLGLLREGGEAVVWRALDTQDGTERALKIYPAEDGGAEAAARELALTRRVAHPHVVRVDDSFVEDGSAFVVMELAEGSLAERVALLGPLSPREAAAALAGPLAALGAAHAAGVVHRDVKPHNLLVFGALDGAFGAGGTATVKLADFGIAQLRAEGTTRTRSGTLLGSLPFLSPEQRRDPKRVGPPTDVYAAAVTLAWLVTGEAPGDLYLPETLAELAANLRARGVPAEEARWVVARVAAGGRLGVSEREGLGVWALGLVGGTDGARDGPLLIRSTMSRSPDVTTIDDGGASDTSRLVTRAVSAALAAAVIGLLAWRTGNDAGLKEPRPDLLASLPRCTDAPKEWVDRVERGPRETSDADIADIDSDGIVDVVFTNIYDQSLSIWWGKRGGIPTERMDIPSKRQATAPAVIDVDNDGRKDLVLALHEDAQLGVIYQTAARTFSSLTTTFQAPAPYTVTGSDIDGDGNTELLLTHANNNNIHLRMGAASQLKPSAQRLILRVPDATRVRVIATPTFATIWNVDGEELLERAVNAQGEVAAAISHRLGKKAISLLPDRAHPGTVVARIAAGDVHAFVRLASGRDEIPPCLIGVRSSEKLVHVFGDIDQDGVSDLIESRTCQYCESNHVFVRGVP